MSSITCIIPTMNRLESLQETMDSYINASSIPEQFVIVDQTQDENKRSEIKKIIEGYSEHTEISYYYQDFPSSTAARNKGLSLAKNDIILFSDDDITVQHDTIRNIREIMGDETISMVAGINSREKVGTSKVSYIFGKASYKNRHIGHVTTSMLGRFPDVPVKGFVDTQWAMGFFFVVRKHLLEKWGIKFDENLIEYAYAEDLDLSYSYYKKSLNEGYKCYLTDRVIVEHRITNEWRTPNKKQTMMYIINRTYLSYKHQVGLIGRLNLFRSFIGDLIFRVVRGGAKDLIHAKNVCNKHINELNKGVLKGEWYCE